MIDAVHRALYAFWSQFSVELEPVPAYLSGEVPDDATLPYITFEVAFGEFLESDYVTGTLWLQKAGGVNTNQQRAQVLGQIAALIPNRSTKVVPLDTGGAILLRRNDVSFQTYLVEPDNTAIVGGRTSLQITFL